MSTCQECGSVKDGMRLSGATLYSFCRVCRKQYSKAYRQRPNAAPNQKMATKRWREAHKEQYAEIRRNDARKHRFAVRKRVLEAYGGAQPSCACCGESTNEFLAVDHIDGGGNAHRRAIGAKTGSAFYTWLERNRFPAGFQLLCHNCNVAKGIHGTCPHQREKAKVA